MFSANSDKSDSSIGIQATLEKEKEALNNLLAIPKQHRQLSYMLAGRIDNRSENIPSVLKSSILAIAEQLASSDRKIRLQARKLCEDYNLPLGLPQMMQLSIDGIIDSKNEAAKDLVLFLGCTGEGISTTVNYLAGVEFEYDHESECLNPKSVQQIPIKMSPGSASVTIYPNFVESNGFQYADIPGFNTTFQGDAAVCSGLALPLTINNSPLIRAVVIVIPYNTVTANNEYKCVNYLTDILSNHLNIEGLVDVCAENDNPIPIVFAVSKLPYPGSRFKNESFDNNEIKMKVQKSLSGILKSRRYDNDTLNTLSNKMQQIEEELNNLQKFPEEKLVIDLSLSREKAELSCQYEKLKKTRNEFLVLKKITAWVENPDKNNVFIVRGYQEQGDEPDDKMKLIQYFESLRKQNISVPREYFHFRKNFYQITKIKNWVENVGEIVLNIMKQHEIVIMDRMPIKKPDLSEVALAFSIENKEKQRLNSQNQLDSVLPIIHTIYEILNLCGGYSIIKNKFVEEFLPLYRSLGLYPFSSWDKTSKSHKVADVIGRYASSESLLFSKSSSSSSSSSSSTESNAEFVNERRVSLQKM